MKKMILLAGIVLLLTGCKAQPTFETVEDVLVQPVMVQTHQMALELPAEASALTVQSGDSGSLYFCDGYTLAVQVLPSGDLNETFLQTTGFEQKDLAVIHTQPEGIARYDWVWTAAGEGEDQICRGALLDDGVNHYVLTCVGDASQGERLQQTWQEVFSSFCLLSEQDLIRTGS